MCGRDKYNIMITSNDQQTAHSNIPTKPELSVNTRILNSRSEFKEKLLCDGPTFSPGSACCFTCTYCYTESMMNRGGSEVWAALKAAGRSFQEVVIRRAAPLQRLREELSDVPAKFKQAPLVIYTSPAVDVAATPYLAKESAELCNEILASTAWDIRILSKSPLIATIAAAVCPPWRHRLILGLSTGTLDDRVARAIEPAAPPPSKRLEALRQLQEQGYRTFAMLCPILPQDPVAYFRQADDLIDFNRCEHVWAEVLNRRGKSMERTAQALEAAQMTEWAHRLRGVFGTGSTPAWEAYARSTFAALTAVVAPNKLRFMQYATDESIGYWMNQKVLGAVPLGEAKDKRERGAALESESLVRLKRSEAAKKAWVTIRRNRAQTIRGTKPAGPNNPPTPTERLGDPPVMQRDLRNYLRSAAARKAWATIQRKRETQRLAGNPDGSAA